MTADAPARSGSSDTIVAVATPPGRGGVGVVRLSGPDAAALAAEVAGTLPEPRLATFRRFRGSDNDILDEGLCLNFPAPNSFTGEHVVEFQGHGGPVVLDMLVRRLCDLGARPARPGEFSERAFINGRMDLAQAEAVADLIDAGSNEAARAALRSLKGEFSEAVHALVEALIQLRMYVEAAIDFPEEEIDFLGDREVTDRLADIRTRFDDLSRRAEQGRIMRDGMNVVIAGRPNAGKSSLLNRLAGHDAAIVTDIPGTTRDVLRERIHIDGMPIHVIDTAGLRESPDEIEAEGIRRARAEVAEADRVLLVVDEGKGLGRQEREFLEEFRRRLPVTVIRNKVDLSGRDPGAAPDGDIGVSATSGAGLDALRDHLKKAMGFRSAGTDIFMARRRHLDALARAREHVDQATGILEAEHAGDLMAEDLRLAQDCLNEITGEFTSDDLLGRIFSSFCIGK